MPRFDEGAVLDGEGCVGDGGMEFAQHGVGGIVVGGVAEMPVGDEVGGHGTEHLQVGGDGLQGLTLGKRFPDLSGIGGKTDGDGAAAVVDMRGSEDELVVGVDGHGGDLGAQVAHQGLMGLMAAGEAAHEVHALLEVALTAFSLACGSTAEIVLGQLADVGVAVGGGKGLYLTDEHGGIALGRHGDGLGITEELRDGAETVLGLDGDDIPREGQGLTTALVGRQAVGIVEEHAAQQVEGLGGVEVEVDVVGLERGVVVAVLLIGEDDDLARYLHGTDGVALALQLQRLLHDAPQVEVHLPPVEPRTEVFALVGRGEETLLHTRAGVPDLGGRVELVEQDVAEVGAFQRTHGQEHTDVLGAVFPEDPVDVGGIFLGVHAGCALY